MSNIDLDESAATPGSRLKIGVAGSPGFAHHIISYRDLCFDSFNGQFFFRKDAAAGDPTHPTDLVTIDASGNMTVKGTLTATVKHFEIPHPFDPDRMRLIHASLEGPEHGVYYRGEGALADGFATVRLPSYFEALARVSGRTVQLTPLADEDGPISALAASAVQGGAFAVRALDDSNPQQRFYWEVKAIRSDLEALGSEVLRSQDTPAFQDPPLVSSVR